MLVKTSLFLALACALVSARPQGNPEPTVALAGITAASIVSVDIVTGRPELVIPVTVNVVATANADSTSVLNPDAPIVVSSIAPIAAQALVEDQAVIQPVQPVVIDQLPIVTSTEATLPSDITTEAATTEVMTDPATVETTTSLIGTTILPASVPSGAALGEWHKGATYNTGDKVTFGGEVFRALQSHRADAYNWTPPQAPALWVKDSA